MSEYTCSTTNSPKIALMLLAKHEGPTYSHYRSTNKNRGNGYEID